MVTYITYTMTIRELLEPLGITSYREFAKRTGLSRQRAWQIWNEKTGVGRKKAQLIAAATGIPEGMLLAIDPTRSNND